MAEDRDLDTAELASRLRMAITRLGRCLRQQDEGELPATLTNALATISRAGPMTLGEVVARERITAPAVTKAIERLVALGLVARRADPADRRLVVVSTTTKGERHLEANRGRRNDWLSGRLEHLDSAEIARLREALQMLEHLLEPGSHGEGPAGPTA